MTTNTFKFIDMVASEALAIAHEQSSLLATVDRQYDEYFGKAGGKIGDTLRVRSPNQYKIRSGNAMDVQAQNEVTQNVTMSTLKGVDMDFSRVDLLLKTDDPKQVAAFSKRYIEPAMSTLISNIEYDIICFFTPSGIRSLFDNYPEFTQNGTLIGAFGNNTVKASEDAGLCVNIKAPAPHSPSMISALDFYLSEISKKK